MTTSPHTLEEALKQIIFVSNHDINKYHEEKVTKLLSLIKTVGKKVIGNSEIIGADETKRINNNLRASQRQALEDIISGKEII